MIYYANNKDRFAYIPLLWVSEEFRNRGIASKMLESFHAYARSIGMNECRLEVRKENIKAYKLYIKNGYEPSEDHHDKILMIARLI